MRNEGLSVQNREMQAMLKHQGEQRSALTTRVAVVKRENKRLEEHIASMESELTVRKARSGAGQRSPHGSQSPGRDAPRPTTRSASSRATSHTVVRLKMIWSTIGRCWRKKRLSFSGWKSG